MKSGDPFEAQAGMISRQKAERRTKLDEERCQRSPEALRPVLDEAQRAGIERIIHSSKLRGDPNGCNGSVWP